MIIEKCRWCGNFYVKQSNAQKYCSSECKHEAQLESKRRYINRRNIRRVYNTRIKNITELGSLGTSSRCHRKSDFEEEEKSIKAEMRMLRIHKNNI